MIGVPRVKRYAGRTDHLTTRYLHLWRIIAFYKGNKPWTGTLLHKTQESAMLAIQLLDRRIASGDNFLIAAAEGDLPEDRYSHAVAVPASKRRFDLLSIYK